MTLPFLTPSRCVLLIGDESLYVYNITFNAARLVDAVPWQTDDFEETVVSLIKKECGGKPVLILNDMTDQHFKGGQRLPKVGVMDKASVLSRKLQVAFPNYPVRGALRVQKAKGGAAANDGAEGARLSPDMYLFAAVPMSEPVAKTLDAARRSMASIVGFYLLPVEAADMVSMLAAKLAGRSRKSSRWIVFIGQHHNGALRQIITRDGQLAMTRMTPITDTDSDPEMWAQEVSQEFRATVSYLSRFGFSAEDGTDVIVISNPKAGQILEQLIDLPCNYQSMTALEAARLVGTGVGAQEDPRFADPLHAAWIGRKQRFSLPMKTPELEKLAQPRQVAAMATLLLVLGAGYLSWEFFAQMGNILKTRSDLVSGNTALAQVEGEYETEVARMKALGFDVKLMEGAIKTFQSLEDRRMKPLIMIQNIHHALGDDMRLDGIKISYVSSADEAPQQQAAAADAYVAPSGKPEMLVSLKMIFPATIEPAEGVQEVDKLRRRLEAALPDYKVDVSRNVAGREFSESVTGTAGRSAEEIKSEEYVAELTIRGEVK